MPSPVSTSVAAAASPVSRTRPVGQHDAVDAGPGSATPLAGPRSTPRPRGRRGCAGRSSRPAHCSRMSLPWRRPSRSTPKPTLARPPGSGNDQAYPGRRSASNQTYRSSRGRSADAGDVLAEGVPLAEVARLGEPGRPRTGLHIPSAATTYRAATGAPPATPTVTWSSCQSQRAVEPLPLEHRGAGGRGATSTSAASSCRRGPTAAYVPAPGGQRHPHLAPRRRPQHGAVDDLPVVDRPPGREPRASSSRRASVVRPSPQHLSRGNVALSSTVDRRGRRGRGARPRRRPPGRRPRSPHPPPTRPARVARLRRRTRMWARRGRRA